MKYNPDVHHRRSIRLKGYDYSRPGAYFVTICTQGRLCLFGDVVDGNVVLNESGRMVQTVWNEIPHHYPYVDIDAFVVMPNHIHGIVVIVGAGPCACPGPRACPDTGQPQGVPGTGQPQGVPDTGQPRGVPGTGQPQGVPGMGQPQGVPGMGQPQGVAPTLSLPDVVHRFKTLTTKRYADGVKQRGWPPFPGRLWQRNYYEHIIRDENELNRIRQYITNNPLRWALDRENP